MHVSSEYGSAIGASAGWYPDSSSSVGLLLISSAYVGRCTAGFPYHESYSTQEGCGIGTAGTLRSAASRIDNITIWNSTLFDVAAHYASGIGTGAGRMADSSIGFLLISSSRIGRISSVDAAAIGTGLCEADGIATIQSITIQDSSIELAQSSSGYIVGLGRLDSEVNSLSFSGSCFIGCRGNGELTTISASSISISAASLAIVADDMPLFAIGPQNVGDFDLVIGYRQVTSEWREQLSLLDGPFLHIRDLTPPDFELNSSILCVRKGGFQRCFGAEHGLIRSVIARSACKGNYSFPGWLNAGPYLLTALDGQTSFAVDLTDSFIDVASFESLESTDQLASPASLACPLFSDVFGLSAIAPRPTGDVLSSDAFDSMGIVEQSRLGFDDSVLYFEPSGHSNRKDRSHELLSSNEFDLTVESASVWDSSASLRVSEAFGVTGIYARGIVSVVLDRSPSLLSSNAFDSFSFVRESVFSASVKNSSVGVTFSGGFDPTVVFGGNRFSLGLERSLNVISSPAFVSISLVTELQVGACKSEVLWVSVGSSSIGVTFSEPFRTTALSIRYRFSFGREQSHSIFLSNEFHSIGFEGTSTVALIDIGSPSVRLSESPRILSDTPTIWIGVGTSLALILLIIIVAGILFLLARRRSATPTSEVTGSELDLPVECDAMESVGDGFLSEENALTVEGSLIQLIDASPEESLLAHRLDE
jgi:hypothetical protein